MAAKRKAKYADRSGIEKITSQWHKLSGLRTREEWSAAVVRAATAAELAATLAIREEFANRTKFKASVVDSFLFWANGLDGKMTKLDFPLLDHRAKDLALAKKLFSDLGKAGVNRKRNMIVHGGHFCVKSEATKLIAACKTFVEGMLSIYYDDFALVDPEATST
jgi:hypothetical protein